MKVLENNLTTVEVVCPYCKSKLQLEKGDVKQYYGGEVGFYIGYYTKCPVCKKYMELNGTPGVKSMV